MPTDVTCKHARVCQGEFIATFAGMAKAKRTARVPKQVKGRPATGEDRLIIRGTFMEVLQASVKDAESKSAPQKKAGTD